MCGVVGIFHLREAAAINARLLTDMNESQFHRGPDEGGVHIEAGVGLGHRRLSIIDLASGQQPLFNEDQSVVVTYNGEIYNYRELADELKAHGHIFRTHSDTEVIVHAWEQWGKDCVKRFRGMFAFAIWDRNRQQLFIARDRLGIKPLYYTKLANDEFIFASELKALRLHPDFNQAVDPLAVEDYFALGYVPDPKTIYASAKKLPPGCTLTLSRGKQVPEPEQYWDVSFSPANFSSVETLEEELIERFREAVSVRLVAEVPLGAFLSGGVDSSAVVALMAQIEPGKPVNTCSIGFGDPKYNETEFARLVADRYRTDHHLEQVDPDDYDLIDTLAGLYDEPFADSSSIPTYRVCQLAKKHVTVALSGDGGDENFAGYRRHRWHMNEEIIRQRLPQFVRGPLFGVMGKFYPKMDWAPKVFRAKSTFQSLARDSVSAYMHSMSVVYDDLRERLFSQSMRKQLNGYHASEVFRNVINSSPTDHPLSLIQYIDMKTYLPGDILTKVDRASMAHALEVRVPILDHHFVDWISGIPPELKLKGNEGKYIFKKALEKHLPNDVLYRPKMGFSVPLAGWFKHQLKDRLTNSLSSELLAETGYFDMGYIKKLIHEHVTGVREHSAALWTLLMFESFLRIQTK